MSKNQDQIVLSDEEDDIFIGDEISPQELIARENAAQRKRTAFWVPEILVRKPQTKPLPSAPQSQPEAFQQNSSQDNLEDSLCFPQDTDDSLVFQTSMEEPQTQKLPASVEPVTSAADPDRLEDSLCFPNDDSLIFETQSQQETLKEATPQKPQTTSEIKTPQTPEETNPFFAMTEPNIIEIEETKPTNINAEGEEKPVDISEEIQMSAASEPIEETRETVAPLLVETKLEEESPIEKSTVEDPLETTPVEIEETKPANINVEGEEKPVDISEEIQMSAASETIEETRETVASLLVETKLEEEAPIEQLAIEQTPLEETSVVETSVVETSVVETSVVETPIEKLAIEQTPLEETSVVETSVVETPIVETVVETPIVETPVVETSVVETPVAETPVVETSVVETPIVETLVVETPIAETPVVETPIVETLVVETPIAETPVVETSVVETPIVETLVVETPVAETPTVETPVVETSVAETPVVETPIVESPVIETSESPEMDLLRKQQAQKQSEAISIEKQKRLEELIEKGRQEVLEIVNRTKTPTRRKPLSSLNQKLFETDITSKNMFEERLKQINERIEKKVSSLNTGSKSDIEQFLEAKRQKLAEIRKQKQELQNRINNKENLKTGAVSFQFTASQKSFATRPALADLQPEREILGKKKH